MKQKLSILVLSLLVNSPISFIYADDIDKAFLKPNEVANEINFLPQPPSNDSIQFIYDKSQYEKYRILHHTPRGKQALLDAKIYESDFGIEKVFSDAFGYELSSKNTPEIVKLLRRLAKDSGAATTKSKKYFGRTRPYIYYQEKTCYPQDEKNLSPNGSYPSGHTTYGWAAALILAEINPEHQNEILKRGYEIGESRIVCGCHWPSDVQGGFLVGSALVARLHTNPDFINQLNKAKQEFTTISKKIKQ